MRRKEIKSLAFFRDLGGVLTKDNKVVKSGLLFRTSETKDLSPEDKKSLLEDYNLSVCIDLRTPEEVEISPDAFKDEIEYFHIPLLSNEENPAVTKETRVAVLKRRIREGGMKKHISQLYRRLINSADSIAGFRQIFDILKRDKEETIAYHCTQGKDRTGMVSAFILAALGVDKETIIKDYLTFNSFHRFKRFWIYVGMFIVFFPSKKATELNYALVARRYYIEAAFEEIEKQYGNLISFLKKAIGLSDNDLSFLRKKYLVNP